MEKDMQDLLFFNEYEAFYSMAAKSDAAHADGVRFGAV